MDNSIREEFVLKSFRYKIPCIIFAGGQSKRMGQNKALLPFGGENSLLEYQIKRLSPYFEKIYVSAKDTNNFDRIDLFQSDSFLDSFDVYGSFGFIEDLKIYKDYAPMVAILSVLEALEDKYIFIISVDNPFFMIEDFVKMYNFIEENRNDFDVIVAQSSKIHPLCSIWNNNLNTKQILKNEILVKNYKLNLFLKKIKTKYISFIDEKVFINMNTLDEYEKAKEIFYEK